MARDLKFAAPVVLFVAAAVTLLSVSSAFALAGATPLLVSGSTSQGAAGGSTTVVLTLTPSDPAGLEELASEPGSARLAPGQFEQTFAPSQTSVAAVESWAAASGLQITSVSADRLLVTLTASRSALGAALGVSFERFQAPDGASYVSSTRTATLPASIAGDVISIAGLSSLERVQVEAPHGAASEVPSIDYPGAMTRSSCGRCTTRRAARPALASRYR